MDIIIGLLVAVAFVLIVIALIRTWGEKSRDKSDKDLGSFEGHEGISESKSSDKGLVSVELHSAEKPESEPFDYRASGWKKRSRQQREQEKWSCHSEQPGENHYRLKGTLDYRGFMKRYGKEWRRGNSGVLK